MLSLLLLVASALAAARATNVTVVASADALALEEGASVSFTLSLDAAPSDYVLLYLGTSDADLTASPSSLNLTAANYADGGAITLSMADDLVDEEASQTLLVAFVLAHSGANDTVALPAALSVVVADNDAYDAADTSLSAVTLDVAGVMAGLGVEAGASAVSGSAVEALLARDQSDATRLALLQELAGFADAAAAPQVAVDAVGARSDLVADVAAAVATGAPTAVVEVAVAVAGGQGLTEATAALAVDAVLDVADGSDEFEGVPGAVTAAVASAYGVLRDEMIALVQARALSAASETVTAAAGGSLAAGTAALQVAAGALGDDDDDRDMTLRTLDCKWTSSDADLSGGVCVSVTPHGGEELSEAAVLTFPAAQDANVCLRSSTEVADEWEAIECDISTDGTVTVSATSFSVLTSVYRAETDADESLTAFFADPVRGALAVSSVDRSGVVEDLPVSAADSRFLDVAVDASQDLLFWSGGQGGLWRGDASTGTSRSQLVAGTVFVDVDGYHLGDDASEVVGVEVLGARCGGVVWYSARRATCLATTTEAEGSAVTAFDVTYTTVRGSHTGGTAFPLTRVAAGYLSPTVAGVEAEELEASVHALALAPASEQVYWSDSRSRRLLVTGYDGLDTFVLATDVGAAHGLALDEDAGVLYFTDALGGTVSRVSASVSALAGGALAEPEELISGLSSPRGLSLLGLDQLVVAERGGRIFAMRSDGGNMQGNADFAAHYLETLVRQPGQARLGDVVVDEAGERIYWAEANTHQIWRAGVDGSRPEPLPPLSGSARLLWPRGLALDADGDRLFYSEFLGRLGSTDLDGGGPVALYQNIDSAADKAMHRVADAAQRSGTSGSVMLDVFE